MTSFFILKSLGGLGLIALLTIGGCQVKNLLLAKEKLKSTTKELALTKSALANERKLTDAAVSDALKKCAAGKQLDAMKKQYKLDAKNCRALLRKKAEAIANQSKKLVR